MAFQIYNQLDQSDLEAKAGLSCYRPEGVGTLRRRQYNLRRTQVTQLFTSEGEKKADLSLDYKAISRSIMSIWVHAQPVLAQISTCRLIHHGYCELWRVSVPRVRDGYSRGCQKRWPETLRV